jgi:hypothetical protein
MSAPFCKRIANGIDAGASETPREFPAHNGPARKRISECLKRTTFKRSAWFRAHAAGPSLSVVLENLIPQLNAAKQVARRRTSVDCAVDGRG